MIFLKKYIEYPIVLFLGGILYITVELLWRGKTHWSMGIAGGVCFAFIYFIRKSCPDIPLMIRCIIGAIVICTIEYIAGFTVNIILGWNIWDYSEKWMNVYGQICPLYAFYWLIICIPGNIISKILENFIIKIRQY